jgi:hypothetical protein
VIRYSLICAAAHEFEAWFRDIATFDDQAATGSLTCPYCQSTQVEKRVMAPHVARRAREVDRSTFCDQTGLSTVAPADDLHRELRARMQDLREKIFTSTEDVGERFPAEARKIHDGDSEPRAIRGRATLAEAKALIDEGVAVLPVPGEGH